MNKIELLAPAGNKEAFFAAINNGADAIYMGGINFSARAFADNFTREDFLELVDYAHLRNVRIYVTLNTLLSDFEFEKACDDVRFYYEHSIDAILVQDLGLFYWIKTNYPEMEVHASTQMHIHNIQGVRNCRKLGFNRVVVARESTLEFIKEACKENIEIETFVHGALCVSYSGQCLLSSATKSRSANKGMCAQCCRLKYELLDRNQNSIKTETDYLLSPKDMYLLEDIPALIKAGVSSLKIEGRMKSAAYVGYVVSCYRKAIDAYYEGANYHLSKKELSNLKVLFNRGFSNTYLHDSKEDLFNSKMPNHQGIQIGEVVSSKNRRVQIRLSDELNQFDGVRIYSDKFDDGFIVNKLYVKNKLVSKAYRNEVIELESSHPFRKGDVLLKTVDAALEKEIGLKENKHLPIELKIVLKENEKVSVSCNEFIYISDIVPERAQKAPLTYESVEKQFSKLNDTPYTLDKVDITLGNVFLRLSDLNSIRNSFTEAYNKHRLNQFRHKGNPLSVTLNAAIPESDEKEMELSSLINSGYCLNPVININSIYPEKEKNVITENGGLLLEGDKIASYTLNVYNSYTYEFFKRLGFRDIVLSSELNDEQISELLRKYKDRNKTEIRPFILKEGKRTLMYIRNNPFDKYQNAYYLKNGEILLEIIKEKDHIQLLEDYHSNSTLNTVRSYKI